MAAQAKDTVLVVEDNTIQQILRDAELKNAGYTKFLIVDNLADAKAELATGKIAAVITDNQYPDSVGGTMGNNGIELIRHIKNDTTLKDTPILLNSSTLDQKIIDSIAAVAGVNKQINYTPQQPIDIDDKVTVVDKAPTLFNEVSTFLDKHIAHLKGSPSAGYGQGGGGGRPR